MSEIASLKRAAEQHISINAQYLLGLMYLYGQDEQGEGQDKTQARNWLDKAAAQNHALAKARLKRLDTSPNEPHNPAALQQAAEQGDSHAQFDLSQLYYYGWAVKQDFAQCFNCLKPAAEQSCPYAQYLFGVLHLKGEGTKEDAEEGFKWVQRAAEQGYAHAQFYLADCCLYNRRIEHSRAKAIEWVSKAAQQDYSQAQCLLGLIHEQGWGVKQDYDKAMALYRKAAEQGNLRGYHRIADLYRSKDDNDQALVWYQKSAEAGYELSQYDLAQMLKHADGIPRDYSKACYWYEKSAEQGNELAAINLAEHYASGSGVERDESKASCWYLQAAKLGHDRAQYEIGQRYETGKGIEKDFKQAEYWYRLAAKQGNYHAKQKVGYIREFKRHLKAAKSGDANAQCAAGNCYARGYGTGQDLAQALHWYLAAAEQGSAEACYRLGSLYEQGEGVAKDKNQALVWYRQAAQSGDEKAKERLSELDTVQQLENAVQQGDPEALYQLGQRHEWGKDGIQRDREKALQYYLSAAEQGHAQAACAAGHLYSQRDNPEQALRWYQKAAKWGASLAHYVLGLFYDSKEPNEGVAKDDEQAAHWYEQAAQQGHVDAQLALAECYLAGRGLAKDEVKALHWYQQAANQGHEEAIACVKAVQDRQALEAKSASSSEDDIDAQYQLGLAYDYGRGVERDFTRAVYHYRNAAERGHADAQFEMGNMVAYAQGTAHSESEAFDWYLKAALRGHKEAHAMLRNIQTFHKTAEAAVQGNAQAQYELALIYEYGDMRPVREDKARGFEWLVQAAENGCAEAQFDLGRSHEDGEFVEKDSAKALYWLNKAAGKGYGPAQDRLQEMDQSKAAEVRPPTTPKTQATPPQSPLWYSAEQLPLLKKALNAQPPAAPPQIRATQQKALDTVLRCAQKLCGEFADKHVEMVKLGMRALRKEADQYDAPDEFAFDDPMFDALSAELRQVRDDEGAFALHCLIDRSKYKIYEDDEPNNFGITVHCGAYANIAWLHDQYSQKNHRAVFKGTPTAAESGFTHDFVYGRHNPLSKRNGMDKLDIWTAAAPIRGSNGKIVAIVEAHILAPELRNHPQWNASR